MDNNTLFWRQLDLLNPEQLQEIEVTLIGAGGIGSSTALCLAKMGIPKLTVYDHDTIEEHNLPNQMYPMITYENDTLISSIGRTKVEMLSYMVSDFSRLKTDNGNGKYESQPLSGIVISGVDSMSTRQNIWEQVKRHKDFIDLYIDARMGAEVAMVYSIDPSNPDQYKFYQDNALYDDRNALEVPCTARAIFYTGFICAGMIGNQVKRFIRKEDFYTEIIFDIANTGIMANGLNTYQDNHYVRGTENDS